MTENTAKFGVTIVKFLKENIPDDIAPKAFENIKQAMKDKGYELEVQEAVSLNTKHWFICRDVNTETPARIPSRVNMTKAMAECLTGFEYEQQDGAVLITALPPEKNPALH